MINIGIIGCGYWGPNLIRNFSKVKNCGKIFLFDLKPERLLNIKKDFSFINTLSNLDEMLNNNEIDAIVIATPVSTHYEIAKKALLKGKHILVEKPLTNNISHAEELIELAEKKQKVLMVDHTYLYHPAVIKIKELIKDGSIGGINYFDSIRINLGLFQNDINVLWDLGPHDLSILNYLIDEKAYSVNAQGICHTNNCLENIAYMTINYNSNIIAHINCSWVSPVKIRHLIIGGDKKMILFNDLEQTEKIKIYDTGYNFDSDEQKRNILVDYRVGDVYIPKIDRTEALFNMANDFVNSIINNLKPRSNSSIGYGVVKLLEASEKSLKENGREILL